MSGAIPGLSPTAPVPHSPQINSPATRALSPIRAVPRNLENDEGGDQGTVDTQRTCVPAIRHHYRRRVDYHNAEKRLTLQIKAICRRLCDGDKDDAGKLYKAMMGGQGAEDAQRLVVSPLIALSACEPLLQARDIVEQFRKDEEKVLTKLGKTLPVWAWCEEIRGVGPLSLAQIIGETGDLFLYANPGKVWKRLGLAPFNGRACSTWRMQGGATADDWVEMGYSPVRRSVAFNVGECFIKAGGKYKEIYDEKKAEYLEREWCGKCHPKGETEPREHCTPAHAHNRAHRYMVKKFIKHLWQEWRK